MAATTLYRVLDNSMMLLGFTHSEIRWHSIKMTKVVSESFMLIIVLKILCFLEISEGIARVSKVNNMYHCI